MLVINIVVSKVFPNILFPKIFFQTFFIFFIFYSKFFYPKLFFSKSLFICVMKNMIRGNLSKLDYRLVRCVEYSSLAYTAHITLDVKSPISSPCCIRYYFAPL